jgi:hypothetical protein
VSALSIADIRIALAELPEGHIPGPEDWNRLSQRLQRELHERIDDLNQALHALIGQDPPSKVIADRGRQPTTTKSERPARTAARGRGHESSSSRRACHSLNRAALSPAK